MRGVQHKGREHQAGPGRHQRDQKIIWRHTNSYSIGRGSKAKSILELKGNRLGGLPHPQHQPTKTECDTEENAEHALVECPTFSTERSEAEAILGVRIEVPTIIGHMLESEANWSAMCCFAETVGKRLRRMERDRNGSPPEAAH
ncbi:hypothetical protein ACLKA6_007139 [Drosophila palustris]